MSVSTTTTDGFKLTHNFRPSGRCIVTSPDAGEFSFKLGPYRDHVIAKAKGDQSASLTLPPRSGSLTLNALDEFVRSSFDASFLRDQLRSLPDVIQDAREFIPILRRATYRGLFHQHNGPSKKAFIRTEAALNKILEGEPDGESFSMNISLSNTYPEIFNHFVRAYYSLQDLKSLAYLMWRLDRSEFKHRLIEPAQELFHGLKSAALHDLKEVAKITVP